MAKRHIENVTSGATAKEMAAIEAGRRDGFSIREVASCYNVSPGLVRLEIARGHLRCVRIARRVVILRADLEAWLKADDEKGELAKA